MALPNNANINQSLGSLLMAVENIRSEIHGIREEMRRSEDKSDASRAAVHRRMDDLVESVGNVEIGLATAKEDIKSMKPVTDEVKRWKLMGIGALGVVGLGGLAMGLTLAGALQRLAVLIVKGV